MIIEQDKIDIPLNAKVWRYLNFEGFISLLHSSSLHFCRIDKLGDKNEGIIPNSIVSQFRLEKPDSGIEMFVNSSHKHRDQLKVNCWHLSEVESVAMWKVYCSNNLGIAIQTTLERLIKSFENGAERLHLMRINYNGFDKNYFSHAKVLYPAFNKHPSYSFENEARIIFYGIDSDGHKSSRTIPTENGNLIKVNLKNLLENIYLSPNVPEGFRDLIELMKVKYKLKFDIVSSIISDTSIHEIPYQTGR